MHSPGCEVYLQRNKDGVLCFECYQDIVPRFKLLPSDLEVGPGVE